MEKQRGVMGMTWGTKVRSLTFVLAVVAALALASGADWVTAFAGMSW